MNENKAHTTQRESMPSETADSRPRRYNNHDRKPARKQYKETEPETEKFQIQTAAEATAEK